MYVCMYFCMYLCMCVCVHEHMYVCAHIHIHINLQGCSNFHLQDCSKFGASWWRPTMATTYLLLQLLLECKREATEDSTSATSTKKCRWIASTIAIQVLCSVICCFVLFFGTQHKFETHLGRQAKVLQSSFCRAPPKALKNRLRAHVAGRRSQIPCRTPVLQTTGA